jgi:hypothetical protein
MSKTHNHLSLEEQAVMQVMLDHGCISREIARSGGAVTDPLAPRSPGRPRTYLFTPPPNATQLCCG